MLRVLTVVAIYSIDNGCAHENVLKIARRGEQRDKTQKKDAMNRSSHSGILNRKQKFLRLSLVQHWTSMKDLSLLIGISTNYWLCKLQLANATTTRLVTNCFMQALAVRYAMSFHSCASPLFVMHDDLSHWWSLDSDETTSQCQRLQLLIKDLNKFIILSVLGSYSDSRSISLCMVHCKKNETCLFSLDNTTKNPKLVRVW